MITRLKNIKNVKNVGMACQKVCKQGTDDIIIVKQTNIRIAAKQFLHTLQKF